VHLVRLNIAANQERFLTGLVPAGSRRYSARAWKGWGNQTVHIADILRAYCFSLIDVRQSTHHSITASRIGNHTGDSK
jgi:hypothetical protein